MSLVNDKEHVEESKPFEEKKAVQKPRNIVRQIMRLLTLVLGVGLIVYVIIHWLNRLGGDSTTDAPPPKDKKKKKTKGDER